MADESEPPTLAPKSLDQKALTVDPAAVAGVQEQPMLDLAVPSTPADPAAVLPADDQGSAIHPFGDYELLGEIARGGMGVVHRARERHSGRLVALKMMLTDGCTDSSNLHRFVLEARATSELSHPGIVAIHAWGEHEGQSFYTMDYVPGLPLNRILTGRPLPVARAVRYLLGMARAVAAAHAQGIVHRDLKPSNIILDPADQPRVLDFGLAKRRGQGSVRRDPATSTATASPAKDATVPAATVPRATPSPNTQKGAVLGTPAYMAPEQARGEHDQVGTSADVHALGAIFFEMLTGRPPFQASTMTDTLLQVLERVPPSVRTLNPHVPATLAAVCQRCLEKDPEARYPDAAGMAEDLERRWHGATRSRRFAGLTCIAGFIVLSLLGLQALFPGADRLQLVEGFSVTAQTVTASGGPLLQEPAGILAVVLGGFVLGVVPLLCQISFLTWLGAWLWYSDQIRWYVALFGLGTLFLGLSTLAPIGLLPAWLPASVVLVSLAIALNRRLRKRGSRQADPFHSEAEPYLQKLFAVPTEFHSKAGIRTPTAATIEFADVEPGKVLQSQANCLLRRGRQRSLDRPVLVWLDTVSKSSDAAAPGVVVHHPSVLSLHAVGFGSEGRFMVTAAAAAMPLAELLERRQLEPVEGVALAVRIAHALQAFHDQGACHGRLSPEWILVRSDLEPLLCPCGVPSQLKTDRTQDVIVLCQLLLGWLPPRSRRWQRQSLAELYRVCDAAVEGEYARPADLAEDLGCALRAALVRTRQRVADVVVIVLFALPMLTFGFVRLFMHLGLWGGSQNVTLTQTADFIADHLMLMLAPSGVLLGYVHGRGLAHHYRLRVRRARRRRWSQQSIRRALVQIAVATALPGLPCYWVLSIGNQDAKTWALWLAPAEMLGFWVVGICLATLITFSELLVGSLRSQAAGELLSWVGIVGSLPETLAGPMEAARISGGLTQSRRPVSPPNNHG